MSTRLTIAATAILSLVYVVLAAMPAYAARAHVVHHGETLSYIAQRYGVSMEVLVRTNRLSDPGRLRIGQVLTIPTHTSGRPSHRNSVRPPSRGQDRSTITRYVVRPGDTLYDIARHFAVTVSSLTRTNALASETLQIGQTLQIPSGPLIPKHRASPPRPPIPPVQPVLRAARSGPEPALQLVVGADFKAPKALRIRSGPKTYYPIVARVAVETPLRIIGEDSGWYQVQFANDVVGSVREEDFRTQDQAPEQSVGRAEIVAEALRYLGTPYVWGGGSSRGVDCSGFVYIVFSRSLPNLARMSSFDYFNIGTAIDRSGLLPGDLVFFTTYAPGPSHVGIYLGDGKFIHASSASAGVTTSSLDDPYYAAHFLGARRLLGP